MPPPLGFHYAWMPTGGEAIELAAAPQMQFLAQKTTHNTTTIVV